MEHPILFSGEMVRAILEGRKTQTRRIVKNKHIPLVEEVLKANGKWVFDTLDYELTTPYGQPGDKLWVRETWAQDWEHNRVFYRADAGDDGGLPYEVSGDGGAGGGVGETKIDKWRPSIFMPRWASRITLEVVNVRVERVRDISFEDCLAEGCSDKYEHYDANCKHEVNGECCQGWHYGQKWNFYYLWNSINAKRGYGWDVNPWVWVVEFRKVE